MKRGNTFLFLPALTMSLVALCCGVEYTIPNSYPTFTPGGFSTVKVVDSRGVEVIFEEPPRRIVSISPAHTEILYALGLGDHVVGIDRFSDYPQGTSDKPRIGDAFTLNLEALTVLEPDLVYTTFSGPVDSIEQLDIKVLYLFAPSDMSGVLGNIQLLGRITGRENQAEVIVSDMEARIEAVMHRLRDVKHGPRLFYELDPALFTVGPSSFIGNILGMLKIRNVAEGAIGPYPQITTEVIVEKDPEVIILGDSSQYLRTGITLDSVVNRPGWGSITAVVNDQVYAFDDTLLSRPGPRIVEGIEGLAEILYPELFP